MLFNSLASTYFALWTVILNKIIFAQLQTTNIYIQFGINKAISYYQINFIAELFMLEADKKTKDK